MRDDRIYRYVERIGNLLVSHSLGNGGKDVALATRQLIYVALGVLGISLKCAPQLLYYARCVVVDAYALVVLAQYALLVVTVCERDDGSFRTAQV